MKSRNADWKNSRVILILSLVFICGAATGAAFYRLGSQKVAAKQAGISWQASNKANTLRQLKQELSLTPEQVTEIETVLDDFAMYYQMLQSQMDEVLTTGRGRIDQVLDDQQRRKFSKIMEELRKKSLAPE